MLKNFLPLRSKILHPPLRTDNLLPQNRRLVPVRSSSSISLAVRLCSASFDLFLEKKPVRSAARYLHRPSFDPTITSPSATKPSAPSFPLEFCICKLKLTSASSAETLLQPKAWILTVVLPKAAAATTVSELALSPSFLNAIPHFELLQGGNPLRSRFIEPYTTVCGIWKYSKAICMLPNYLANGWPPLASLEAELGEPCRVSRRGRYQSSTPIIHIVTL
jgi:hypothetical protein